MKKIVFILAALAMAATACNKAEEISAPDYSNVPVKVSLSLPQSVDTKSNFTFTDSGNPIGGFNVTWAESDAISLCLWQTDTPDNSYNNSNQLVLTYYLPAAAEGLDTYDLSSVIGTIDLSSFDSEKKIKYVIAKGGVNSYWKTLSFNNGVPYISPSADLKSQLGGIGMLACTAEQEVAFPSGSDPLELKGKLNWVTSALAIQFDVQESAKDILYAKDSYFVVQFSGSYDQFINNFYPSNMERWYGASSHRAMVIYASSTFKLGDVLDARNCRYGAIPADGLFYTGSTQKLAGSKLQVRYTVDGGSDTTVDVTDGTIGGAVSIDAGKVYGIRIRVTDSDSDGVPEFTKY